MSKPGFKFCYPVGYQPHNKNEIIYDSTRPFTGGIYKNYDHIVLVQTGD